MLKPSPQQCNPIPSVTIDNDKPLTKRSIANSKPIPDLLFPFRLFSLKRVEWSSITISPMFVQ